MEAQSQPDRQLAETISKDIFRVMPLLKKRLTRLNAIQSEHGIPLSHVQVLAMLNEKGSMTISEISQHFDIAKPNITPLVDRLIAANLVGRLRNNADRRVVNVVILPAGQKKLLEIQASLDEYVSSWATSMSTTDFRNLAESLENIMSILGKI